jgi:hypothetical protein
MDQELKRHREGGLEWYEIGKLMNLTTRQVREHWEIVFSSHVPFSSVEDAAIRHEVEVLNNRKWLQIARSLGTSRSASQVKNRYRSLQRRAEVSSPDDLSPLALPEYDDFEFDFSY